MLTIGSYTTFLSFISFYIIIYFIISGYPKRNSQEQRGKGLEFESGHTPKISKKKSVLILEKVPHKVLGERYSNIHSGFMCEFKGKHLEKSMFYI